MSQNILIIGGVALGPKAAARAGRLLPDANITMIDQGTYISYGGCGIPYFVGGDVQQMNGLRTTNAGVVRDEAFFTTQKNVKTFCHTRALSIDRRAKTVTVENTETGEQSQMPYDKLVIATGSSPRIPPLPGVDLRNVTSVTCLEAAQEIQQRCAANGIQHAVIIGAGFIGYLNGPVKPLLRLVSTAGGLCLVIPGTLTDVIGVALIALVCVLTHMINKKTAPAEAEK